MAVLFQQPAMYWRTRLQDGRFIQLWTRGQHGQHRCWQETGLPAPTRLGGTAGSTWPTFVGRVVAAQYADRTDGCVYFHAIATHATSAAFGHLLRAERCLTRHGRRSRYGWPLRG